MSTTFTADTKISPPKWDGKRETFDVYDWQFRNFAAISSLSDALEPSLMANCPTKTEYSALDKLSTDPAVLVKIKIYRDNEKLCGMFVYGNNSAVRKAALKSTASADYPLGLIHMALDRLADSYIQKDITAVIDLENQAQQVRFKRGTEYYAEVTEVLSHFTCTLSEKELIKDMAKKTQNPTYAKMIQTNFKRRTPTSSCFAMSWIVYSVLLVFLFPARKRRKKRKCRSQTMRKYVWCQGEEQLLLLQRQAQVKGVQQIKGCSCKARKVLTLRQGGSS